MAFLDEKLRSLGTAACPPYHLAVVIGGTSAEFTLKTAKLASARYLDTLPTTGSSSGHGFRDLELEAEVLELTQQTGIGAQFGGKYFCHDVRVVRLPRHGASLPGGHRRVVLGRPPGARQDHRRGRVPRAARDQPGPVPARGHRRAPDDDVVRSTSTGPWTRSAPSCRSHPVKTRLSLTGTMVVARDIAHAKIKERLDAGEPMPQYLRDHPVYYAGPAKTPEGYASGSFGPTTAGRMDSYVESSRPPAAARDAGQGQPLQAGHRRLPAHGGFYLGSIGGPAAPGPGLHHARSRCSSTPSSGMEAGVEDRGRRTSRRSSWSTTRATTSSPIRCADVRTRQPGGVGPRVRSRRRRRPLLG
jgi:fumarate hydratase, class I